MMLARHGLVLPVRHGDELEVCCQCQSSGDQSSHSWLVCFRCSQAYHRACIPSQSLHQNFGFCQKVGMTHPPYIYLHAPWYCNDCLLCDACGKSGHAGESVPPPPPHPVPFVLHGKQPASSSEMRLDSVHPARDTGHLYGGSAISHGRHAWEGSSAVCTCRYCKVSLCAACNATISAQMEAGHDGINLPPAILQHFINCPCTLSKCQSCHSEQIVGSDNHTPSPALCTACTAGQDASASCTRCGHHCSTKDHYMQILSCVRCKSQTHAICEVTSSTKYAMLCQTFGKKPYYCYLCVKDDYLLHQMALIAAKDKAFNSKASPASVQPLSMQAYSDPTASSLCVICGRNEVPGGSRLIPIHTGKYTAHGGTLLGTKSGAAFVYATWAHIVCALNHPNVHIATDSPDLLVMRLGPYTSKPMKLSLPAAAALEDRCVAFAQSQPGFDYSSFWLAKSSEMGKVRQGSISIIKSNESVFGKCRFWSYILPYSRCTYTFALNRDFSTGQMFWSISSNDDTNARSVCISADPFECVEKFKDRLRQTYANDANRLLESGLPFPTSEAICLAFGKLSSVIIYLKVAMLSGHFPQLDPAMQNLSLVPPPATSLGEAPIAKLKICIERKCKDYANSKPQRRKGKKGAQDEPAIASNNATPTPQESLPMLPTSLDGDAKAALPSCDIGNETAAALKKKSCSVKKLKQAEASPSEPPKSDPQIERPKKGKKAKVQEDQQAADDHVVKENNNIANSNKAPLSQSNSSNGDAVKRTAKKKKKIASAGLHEVQDEEAKKAIREKPNSRDKEPKEVAYEQQHVNNLEGGEEKSAEISVQEEEDGCARSRGYVKLSKEAKLAMNGGGLSGAKTVLFEQQYKPSVASDGSPFHKRQDYGKSDGEHHERAIKMRSIESPMSSPGPWERFDPLKLIPRSTKYRLLREESRTSVRVGKSGIAGIGLFAMKPFVPGEMVIEYVGEIVGQAMADRREALYNLHSRTRMGCYLFRLDANRIIDATMVGNCARFINHSCDPNCVARNLTINGTAVVVISAKKHINVGEELAYDYKFSYEPDGSRVPCHCGVAKCSGWMN